MAYCKYCGAKIEWAENENGKKIPVNVNGDNHFRTCKRFHQLKAEKESARKEREREKLEAMQPTLF